MPLISPLPPPSYASCRPVVGPADNPAAEFLSIELSDPPEKIYDLGDFIVGSVVLCARKEMVLSYLQVALFITDSVMSKSDSRINKSIVVAKFTLPFTSETQSLSGSQSYRYDFSIVIPSYISTPDDKTDLHLPLAPSMGSGFNGGAFQQSHLDVSDMSARVSYSVRADLIADQKLYRSMSLPVRILPKVDSSPAYINSYLSPRLPLLMSNSIFKVSKKSRGFMSVAVESVPLLYVSKDRPSMFEFIFDFSDLSSLSSSNPSLRMKSLRYRVCAETRSWPNGKEWYDSANPDYQSVKDIIISSKFRVADSAVQWISPSSAFCSVPILIDADPLQLVPTFSSMIIQRDYAVTFKLEFASGFLPVEFSVPVRVVNR